MYKTILVPLDGSKRAERILPYVEEIASARDAVVVLLQVVEPATTAMSPYDLPNVDDKGAVDRMLAATKLYLSSLVGEVRERGIAAKYVVDHGPTVRAILDVAEREQADLIAMASHGRTGVARVFYGSVAAGVMQQADRPLLLIRADES